MKKTNMTDVVAIAGIVLAVTFSAIFFKSLADTAIDESNKRQAEYLKVTQGVPQHRMPLN